jgi:hypothetical protein
MNKINTIKINFSNLVSIIFEITTNAGRAKIILEIFGKISFQFPINSAKDAEKV